VLTDANTGSAAEMFVALIRDRGIAKTVGKHTFGLGCGFLDGGPSFVLPSARLAFSIPNCVRLRADGTDEVAGIAPDIPVEAAPGESARGVASRALQAIAADRARTPDRRN
jgi:C-terminal processing protease CtpA/Prc